MIMGASGNLLKSGRRSSATVCRSASTASSSSAWSSATRTAAVDVVRRRNRDTASGERDGARNTGSTSHRGLVSLALQCASQNVLPGRGRRATDWCLAFRDSAVRDLTVYPATSWLPLLVATVGRRRSTAIRARERILGILSGSRVPSGCRQTFSRQDRRTADRSRLEHRSSCRRSRLRPWSAPATTAMLVLSVTILSAGVGIRVNDELRRRQVENVIVRHGRATVR